MKLEFIKRGADSRLILIFAGWSTDSRYYIDCVADGWDTAVIYDYRDLSMPPIPDQYSTIYIFAYSLGVFAASQTGIDAVAKIAICGTAVPVSDEFGIPEAMYKGTADGLTASSLRKFHLRMAGDKARFEKILKLLPAFPNIENLREELYSIASNAENDQLSCINWNKAYIATNDRIIPALNQERFWDLHPDVVKIDLISAHAVDISKIVRECIPDTKRIGEGFGKAVATYRDNAVIQADICRKIGVKLKDLLADRSIPVESVLEIGVGNGLLTDVWCEIVRPGKADFIDLNDMKKFGIADHERYFTTDAERWLENSEDNYDLILSASAIQWFADPIGFVRTVKEHLNPGGIAIISTFVKGNLRQLDTFRPCPIIYRYSSEYEALPEVQSFEKWESSIKFSSSREMLMHLKLTGVSPLTNHKGRRKEMERHAHPIKLSELPDELTYCPMIMIIKESASPRIVNPENDFQDIS